jgi:hypothetical protein
MLLSIGGKSFPRLSVREGPPSENWVAKLRHRDLSASSSMSYSLSSASLINARSEMVWQVDCG